MSVKIAGASFRRKILATLLFIVCAGVAVFIYISGSKQQISFAVPSGGDFTVSSTTGTLDTTSLRGNVVFLFFGFTHCPHICPMTLSNLNTMVRDLPAELKSRVKILFISIDPERDDMTVLKNKIKPFEPDNFIAATSDDESLKQITSQFGARYSIIKQPGQSPFVDHTTNVFVINTRGEWVDTLDFKVPSEEFRHAFETADDKTPLSSRTLRLSSIALLGVNENCDLASTPCTVFDDENNAYTIRLNPLPVKEGQTVTLSVMTASPRVPMAVDIQGVEKDMGYIRPSLARGDTHEYRTEFDLPVCDLATMTWRIHLITQGEDTAMGALGFRMTTVKE